MALDLVGDVRDHLDGLAQVFASPLLVDDVLVDASGGDVVGLAGRHIQEALVVAQVQVGLGAILGHEALPVLVGIERARIHVDVRVQLLDGDREATRLQELGQAGTDDALTQGGGHPSGHENILGGARHRCVRTLELDPRSRGVKITTRDQCVGQQLSTVSSRSELEADPGAGQKGQLVHPLVPHAVEIEDVLPVVRVGEAHVQLDHLVLIQLPDLGHTNIHPVVGR